MKRYKFSALVALAASAAILILVAGTAHAEQTDCNPKRAVIHFADLGGIKDWRAVDRETLYIEGRNKRWFKATFMGPCTGIMFIDAIAFVTGPSGDLDKFCSIFVDGRRCHFRTFEPVDGPPK